MAPPALNWEQRHRQWAKRKAELVGRWTKKRRQPPPPPQPGERAAQSSVDEPSRVELEHQAMLWQRRLERQTGSTEPETESLRAQLQQEYRDQLQRLHQARQERRAHKRAQVTAAITYTSESNFFTGLTQDVSEGGIFIATHTPLPLGNRVTLRFTLPDGDPPIEVRGEVRWRADYNQDSDGNPGFGVKFIDLKEQDRERIERFVALRESLLYDE